MPEGTLGIDIGESSLKAVLVGRGMRGGYSVALAEAISYGDGGVPEALDKLREMVDFRKVRINLSLPATVFSFRNVKLPFREEKKIRQTIAFELETLLPHGVDDCILDYNIINQSKHSEIFAAVVSRSVLKKRISLFGEHPPQIGTIGINAAAVVSLLTANRLLTGSCLLLDIGVSETTAVFVQKGKIVQVRRYAFGGDYFKGAATERDVSSFCRDLQNTLEFLKWGGMLDDGLSHIFLTGGGSLNSGIKEELARSFPLSIESLDLADICGIQLTDGVKKTWQPTVMNQALALSVNKYKKGQGFNFLLRELDSGVKREQFGKTLKWGAAVLSLSLILIATDTYLDYRYARLRLDNVKKEITALFKASAPEVTRIVDPVQQFKVKIAETKKITLGLAGINGSAMVLDVLKDISVLIPPATEFLITGFNLEEERLSIKGTAKNFDAVDTIKKELAKSKYLKSVQIGVTSLVKQGDKVEFDMRMTVQK